MKLYHGTEDKVKIWCIFESGIWKCVFYLCFCMLSCIAMHGCSMQMVNIKPIKPQNSDSNYLGYIVVLLSSWNTILYTKQEIQNIITINLLKSSSIQWNLILHQIPAHKNRVHLILTVSVLKCKIRPIMLKTKCLYSKVQQFVEKVVTKGYLCCGPNKPTDLKCINFGMILLVLKN